MRIPLLIAAFAALFSTVASGQNVKVKEVKFQVQPTPEFEVANIRSKKVSSARSWLEVEVEFEAKQTNREGIYPELKFRFHVAIKGKDGYYYLTGDVDHINVAAETELYSVMYASPTTLGVITGDFEKFQEGDVKSVAVEVFENGVRTGGDSEGESGEWWKSSSLKKNGGSLLSKSETPFATLWIDRYADVKPASR